MSTPTTPHTININRGAMVLLRSILAGAGWAKGDKATLDIILGGGLLAEGRMPDPGTAPTDPEKLKEWAAVAVDPFTLSEKERESVKRCINHFAEDGRISAVVPAAELLRAFGYGE